jgi:hypothetical protein
MVFIFIYFYEINLTNLHYFKKINNLKYYLYNYKMYSNNKNKTNNLNNGK